MKISLFSLVSFLGDAADQEYYDNYWSGGESASSGPSPQQDNYFPQSNPNPTPGFTPFSPFALPSSQYNPQMSPQGPNPFLQLKNMQRPTGWGPFGSVPQDVFGFGPTTWNFGQREKKEEEFAKWVPDIPDKDDMLGVTQTFYNDPQCDYKMGQIPETRSTLFIGVCLPYNAPSGLSHLGKFSCDGGDLVETIYNRQDYRCEFGDKKMGSFKHTNGDCFRDQSTGLYSTTSWKKKDGPCDKPDGTPAVAVELSYYRDPDCNAPLPPMAQSGPSSKFNLGSCQQFPNAINGQAAMFSAKFECDSHLQGVVVETSFQDPACKVPTGRPLPIRYGECVPTPMGVFVRKTWIGTPCRLKPEETAPSIVHYKEISVGQRCNFKAGGGQPVGAVNQHELTLNTCNPSPSGRFEKISCIRPAQHHPFQPRADPYLLVEHFADGGCERKDRAFSDQSLHYGECFRSQPKGGFTAFPQNFLQQRSFLQIVWDGSCTPHY